MFKKISILSVLLFFSLSLCAGGKYLSGLSAEILREKLKNSKIPKDTKRQIRDLLGNLKHTDDNEKNARQKRNEKIAKNFKSKKQLS